jgi:hypothetical protein
LDDIQSELTVQPRVELHLETRVASIGDALARRMKRLLAAVPGSPQGPVNLARAIGVDKVLASRVLRAAASKDPIAALQLMPGPEPLRRLALAAGKKGVPDALVSDLVEAVTEFDDLIRNEAGDRIGLDAILAAWLPEARAEFELRRKQAAFRALSQLKGHAAETFLSTVFMHPSSDGEHIDVVWIIGLLGLQRLRPGIAVKFATRRVASGDDGAQRRPRTLDGASVEGFDGLRLDEFCSAPPANLQVHRVRDVVHYTLAGDGFGPRSATDLVFAEVNLAEIPRYVPAERKRKRHVFAEVTTPSKLLVFDALVHDEIASAAEPTLHIYDTSFEGVADVNDPSRDIDRMDLIESIQSLGRGISKFRVAEVPWYSDLLRRVCEKLGWNGEEFRAHRCRIDYPIYGSQVAMAFDTTARAPHV